jgi:hypothetical protein
MNDDMALRDALRALGFEPTSPRGLRHPLGHRVRWVGERAVMVATVRGGPPSRLTLWTRASRPSVVRSELTGDLAFDGELQVQGSVSAVRTWLRPARRRWLRWLVRPHEVWRVGPGSTLAALDPEQGWPKAAATLLAVGHWGSPDRGTLPQLEPDPRVRALLALELLSASRPSVPRLVEIMDELQLPAWIRLEAALVLHRIPHLPPAVQARARRWRGELERGGLSLTDAAPAQLAFAEHLSDSEEV